MRITKTNDTRAKLTNYSKPENKPSTNSNKKETSKKVKPRISI